MPVSVTRSGLLQRLDEHDDASVCGGELDGVRQQVPDHLLQPDRVAAHRRDRQIGRERQRDVLGERQRSDRIDGDPRHRDQIDLPRRHLQRARDDAGDIEQVVDDVRQRRRVPFDRRDRAAGGVGPGGRQHAGQPSTAFSGVRVVRDRGELVLQVASLDRVLGHRLRARFRRSGGCWPVAPGPSANQFRRALAASSRARTASSPGLDVSSRRSAASSRTPAACSRTPAASSRPVPCLHAPSPCPRARSRCPRAPTLLRAR